MTTMPQRLREIAAMAHYAMLVHERILVADSLRAIAAELEAHAADEVPVVASLAQKQDAKLPYEIIEAIDRLCISWSRRDCKGQPRVDARQVLQDVVCSVIASREARISELEAEALERYSEIGKLFMNYYVSLITVGVTDEERDVEWATLKMAAQACLSGEAMRSTP